MPEIDALENELFPGADYALLKELIAANDANVRVQSIKVLRLIFMAAFVPDITEYRGVTATTLKLFQKKHKYLLARKAFKWLKKTDIKLDTERYHWFVKNCIKGVKMYELKDFPMEDGFVPYFPYFYFDKSEPMVNFQDEIDEVIKNLSTEEKELGLGSHKDRYIQLKMSLLSKLPKTRLEVQRSSMYVLRFMFELAFEPNTNGEKRITEESYTLFQKKLTFVKDQKAFLWLRFDKSVVKQWDELAIQILRYHWFIKNCAVGTKAMNLAGFPLDLQTMKNFQFCYLGFDE